MKHWSRMAFTIGNAIACLRFHHLQVSNGAKNGTFGAISQLKKLGFMIYSPKPFTGGF